MKIIELLKWICCPKCKHLFTMKWSGSWNGGWNELCGQAISRSGRRCYDCGHFEWDETDDEYETSLPSWCKSNRELTLEKK